MIARGWRLPMRAHRPNRSRVLFHLSPAPPRRAPKRRLNGGCQNLRFETTPSECGRERFYQPPVRKRLNPEMNLPAPPNVPPFTFHLSPVFFPNRGCPRIWNLSAFGRRPRNARDYQTNPAIFSQAADSHRLSLPAARIPHPPHQFPRSREPHAIMRQSCPTRRPDQRPGVLS